MVKIKPVFAVFALIVFNTCNFIVSSQEQPNVRQIELRNAPDIRYVHSGKLVKIDFKAADSVTQIKGRITEIGDSSIVVSGIRISVNSIEAIYVNHLVLGT